MIGDIGEGHHEFDGAFKEKLVAPRRRRPQKGDDDDAEDGSGAGVSSDPPVAKKNGGWSEISAEGAATVGGESSKRRGASSAKALADDDDDDDGIPTIPDLDEAAADAEEAVRTVAMAPAARANAKVPTLAELDAQVHTGLPSTAETGVDTSILTQSLYPAELLAEPDEEWTFDQLLTEISHDLLIDESAAAARAGLLQELESKAGQKPLGAGGAMDGRLGARGALATKTNMRLSDE